MKCKTYIFLGNISLNIPFSSFDTGLILLTIKLILSQTLVPWTLTFIVPIQTIQESITDFPVWNTMSRASGTFQWSLRTSTAQAVTLILIRTVHAVNDAITSVDHVDAHKDLKLKNFVNLWIENRLSYPVMDVRSTIVWFYY